MRPIRLRHVLWILLLAFYFCWGRAKTSYNKKVVAECMPSVEGGQKRADRVSSKGRAELQKRIESVAEGGQNSQNALSCRGSYKTTIYGLTHIELYFFNLLWILRICCTLSVLLDTAKNWKLKTEKYCSKMIFKCVNSTMRLIFNEKVVEKWNLWIRK